MIAIVNQGGAFLSHHEKELRKNMLLHWNNYSKRTRFA